MILTVTLNPSVDISYKLEQLSLDTVNRVADVAKTTGGKGLNVARVLRQLDEDVATSGFLGGSLGDFIRTGISSQGIHDYFLGINGDTRNCIAVIHEGKQTELLESGPVIAENEAAAFLQEFARFAPEAAVLTISGSLPKGVDDDFYSRLIRIADEHDTPVLLDTKGELLHHTLEQNSRPFLIKPNEEELADLLGEKLENEAQVMSALQTQRFADIPWVVVTTGASGAYVKHGQQLYSVRTPAVDTANPVGSGDSVIAGFASGLSQRMDDKTLIQYSMAMGVLNAMEDKTGSINPANINWCMNQITIETVPAS